MDEILTGIDLFNADGTYKKDYLNWLIISYNFS